jgi:hypothetical protein
MQKMMFSLVALLLCFNLTFSQTTVTKSGDITSDETWTNDKVYILDGFVYVTNNAKVTIQPGTLIKGRNATKGALIVTRGSQLIANGTASQPIVFTSEKAPGAGSRRPGDWGGVILLGKAPVNQVEPIIEGGLDVNKARYGGTDPNDNSGILRYVRIEYSGIPFQPDKEINGLTMGGVGAGTIIDHVQVSFSGDDSYEWFGGNVNGKYLISYKPVDDDFDSDYGFQGKVQYGLIVRTPELADVSGSNGFESDNENPSGFSLPRTNAVFSNITLIGPRNQPNTSIEARHDNGLLIRRNSEIKLFNSVVVGFADNGILINGAAGAADLDNDSIVICNTIVSDNGKKAIDTSGMGGATLRRSPIEWLLRCGNETLSVPAKDMFVDPFGNEPNFMVKPGIPALTGAEFINSSVDNPFFDKVSYRGAFTDKMQDYWVAGWSNFRPDTNAYTSGISSVAKLETITRLTAYPNPAKNQVTVNFDLNRGDDITVVVFDLNGQEVLSLPMRRLEAGNQDIELNTENLVNGLYTLWLKGASYNISTSVRLVINK